MTEKADDIRITDLANPVHTQAAKDILGSVAGVDVTLDVTSVLDAAAQRTEMVELPDDYIERMTVLLECMQADEGQSDFGRILNFNYCVDYVVQRCRLERLYQKHPEIDDVEIDRPIMIVGLPRSGTSHMLNLVSVDERLRSLPLWESMEPFPAESEMQASQGEDPRIQRCRDRLAMQEQIMPHFKSMHDMQPEHIEEESHLMLIDFATVLLDNYCLSERWRDYYLAMDQTPHYENLRRMLKALQWLRGPQRWVLKSPQHMEHLGPVSQVFPDATFVFPHRDPVSVVTSMITMMAYSARMSRDPVDPVAIGDYWCDRIGRMLQACVRDYELLPAGQVIDVPFHEFMNDDVAMIERIYALAGHPMTPDVRERMARYMLDHPRGKHGRIIYDIEQDFGIRKSALYERFAFYTDRFGIELESAP